jgi:hypothetical protein
MKLRPVITGPDNTLYEEGVTVGYIHFCPGCKEHHYINVHAKNHMGAVWTFDGNMDKPTFNPSIKLLENDLRSARCHYWIRNGRIDYCSDCRHSLAGQTVDLPEIEE